jgi:hypothetical protein
MDPAEKGSCGGSEFMIAAYSLNFDSVSIAGKDDFDHQVRVF